MLYVSCMCVCFLTSEVKLWPQNLPRLCSTFFFTMMNVTYSFNCEMPSPRQRFKKNKPEQAKETPFSLLLLYYILDRQQQSHRFKKKCFWQTKNYYYTVQNVVVFNYQAFQSSVFRSIPDFLGFTLHFF